MPDHFSCIGYGRICIIIVNYYYHTALLCSAGGLPAGMRWKICAIKINCQCKKERKKKHFHHTPMIANDLGKKCYYVSAKVFMPLHGIYRYTRWFHTQKQWHTNWQCCCRSSPLKVQWSRSERRRLLLLVVTLVRRKSSQSFSRRALEPFCAGWCGQGLSSSCACWWLLVHARLALTKWSTSTNTGAAHCVVSSVCTEYACVNYNHKRADCSRSLCPE